MAVTCLAAIDFVFTWFNLVSLISRNSWGLFSLIFLMGPLCGVVGARRLNRPLVGVYLFFCLVKVAYEFFIAVFLALHAFAGFLWLLVIAFVQLWIIKIVATFWVALGTLNPNRKWFLVGYS